MGIQRGKAVGANREQWFPKWLGYWMTIARPLCLSLFLSLLQTAKTNIIKRPEKITKCDLFWFEQIIYHLNLAAEISMVTEFLVVRFCVTCVLLFILFYFFVFYDYRKQGSGVQHMFLQPLLLPCVESLTFLSVGIYTMKFIIFILENSICKNTTSKQFN